MTEETEMQEVSKEIPKTEEQQEMSDVKMVKKGDIVKGTVIKIDEDEVFVDIGYKYDGIIPFRELSSVKVENASDAVEVGKEVELKVVSIDDEKEKCILSKRLVDNENAWDILQNNLENNVIMEATVAEVVKGGLVVDVGMRGFIPASMVERHFVEDFSEYKGRTLKLRVKELDKEKNKVILSQKDVLDEEYNAKKQQILQGIEAGQELEGTVQRLTPFGAFVDIGGIDGLVHISELSWHHVEQPSEVVGEGDLVKVHVLKVDPANERISLSIKHTQPGPWEKAPDQFHVGDIVTGTVKRLVSFGAFVEITSGVEGLVHISQISHHHIGTPQEVLKEGQEIQVKVLDLNVDEKRVSLSIKATEEAPLDELDPKNIENYDELVKNQSLNLTLGERFGDKLNKFK